MNATDQARLLAHVHKSGADDFYPLPSGIDLQDAETFLTAFAATCAKRAAYLMRRGAAGCGDNGHETAKAYADKRQRAVRKALGFAYP